MKPKVDSRGTSTEAIETAVARAAGDSMFANERALAAKAPEVPPIVMPVAMEDHELRKTATAVTAKPRGKSPMRPSRARPPKSKGKPTSPTSQLHSFFEEDIQQNVSSKSIRTPVDVMTAHAYRGHVLTVAIVRFGSSPLLPVRRAAPLQGGRPRCVITRGKGPEGVRSAAVVVFSAPTMLLTTLTQARACAAAAGCAAVITVATITGSARADTFSGDSLFADQHTSGFFEDISVRLQQNGPLLRYGVSIVDVDGDGLFEAFVCGYNGANSLYKYVDGQLQDIAGSLGIAAPNRQAIGVASCDVDGDGDEEIYVLNTDSYSGDKVYADHLWKLRRGKAEDLMLRDVNSGSRSSFAGRSVACVDRKGDGRYGVAAASYGRPLLLYEMPGDAKTGAMRDVAREAGFVGVTGGRGITGGPLYPGKDYTATPGMDVYMDNERGPSFFFRNDGRGRFDEVAGALGLSDPNENGRGVALLDGNADGHIDIVTGNCASSHFFKLAAHTHANTYTHTHTIERLLPVYAAAPLSERFDLSSPSVRGRDGAASTVAHTFRKYTQWTLRRCGPARYGRTVRHTDGGRRGFRQRWL